MCACASGGGAQTEGQTESPSRLCATSVEPNVRLTLTDREIIT